MLIGVSNVSSPSTMRYALRSAPDTRRCIRVGRTFHRFELHGDAQEAISFLLRFDFHFVLQQLLAHVLVRSDQRQIPNRDAHDAEGKQKENGQLRKLVPNAKAGVHARSKS